MQPNRTTIRVTSDVSGSMLPTLDESVTAALDAQFEEISRTNRGLIAETEAP